jgi:predicted dehydrogenase
MDKIRWGILGTGTIASQFAQGLNGLPDATLLAVGSRSNTTAQPFATQFKVPRAYASYEALAGDNDIDVVYIATPHPMHKHHCMLCLEAGKAVLCEKPFTINADEASAIVEMARQKQLFCMEAMWMRFFPVMAKVRSLLDSNEIGDIRMIVASMGFLAPHDPDNRFFNLSLGGGALLDLGVYPLSFIFQLLGKPTSMASHAHIGITGVDEQAAAILGFEQGRLAVFTTSLLTHNVNDATIMGSKGQIRIHAPLLRPNRISITRYAPPSSRGKPRTGTSSSRFGPSLLRKLVRRLVPSSPRRSRHLETITVPYTGSGHQYEAEEVMRCLQMGKLESDLMPLDETVEIMKMMDGLRAQWNLRYPQEKRSA